MTNRRQFIQASVSGSAILGLGLAGCSKSDDKKSGSAIKAGFVYVSPIGDAGWTYQHDLGRLEMEKSMAGKVTTSFVEKVAEGADAERVIREMASSGNKIVFATSFGYMNYVEKVAKDFPKVVFMHATGYKSGENFGNYNARFYEGRYLTGVIAGKMTKSNILGYVAAFPIPEVLQGINAFTLGARSVNPKVDVRVIWVNSWYDPGKEREAAMTLIAQKADVVTHHTDSTAAVQAAEEKGGLRLRLSLGYVEVRCKGASHSHDPSLGCVLHQDRPRGDWRDLEKRHHLGWHERWLHQACADQCKCPPAC
jgi:basic membrane protein A